MANVKIICRKIGIQSLRVVEKANELYRISKIRRPILGRAEFARGALCVDCACRVCGETPRDINKLIKLSGVNKTMYNSLLGQFQTLLSIRAKATHSVRSLAIQFSMSSMVPFVEATLETFKERFINSLADERKAHAKFTSPAYKAAAFFLCAQKRKRSMDKYKLLKLTAVDAHEFKSTCNVMLLHCFDTLGVGKKSDLIEATDHRELMDNCRMSNINQSSDIEKERKYQECKQKVLESRKKSSSDNHRDEKRVQPATKKRKLPSPTSTNDENIPNGKVPKKPSNSINAPAPEKRKATKQITKSKQPTIDDFVNTLMRYEKTE